MTHATGVNNSNGQLRSVLQVGDGLSDKGLSNKGLRDKGLRDKGLRDKGLRDKDNIKGRLSPSQPNGPCGMMSRGHGLKGQYVGKQGLMHSTAQHWEET